MASTFEGRKARDAKVDLLMVQHATSLAAAVLILKNLVPSSLQDVHIGKFDAKQKAIVYTRVSYCERLVFVLTSPTAECIRESDT